MKKITNLTGMVFGNLRVLGYSHSDERYRSWWRCEDIDTKQKRLSRSDYITAKQKKFDQQPSDYPVTPLYRGKRLTRQDKLNAK